MKIIVTALCLITFVSCKKEHAAVRISEPSLNDSIPAEDTSAGKMPAPQNIEEIKREFTILNQKVLSKKLDSSGFTYECEETYGEGSFYYENGQLSMVRYFTADSHFSSVTRYYLKHDEIFFIFREDTVWRFDGGTAEKPVTRDDISQQRVYLVNGNPVQCLQKEFTVRSVGRHQDPEKIPNRKTRCDIRELMKDYLRVLKNIDKKGRTDCI